MLNQLSDRDSGLRPRSTAESSDAEGTHRHLSQEDLEAYAKGRLTPARLDDCRTHLDSCDACRAELEDLRTLLSESAGFPRSEPTSRELQRRKRRRRLTPTQVASVATILVAAASTALWWTHEHPRAKKTPAPVTIAQLPAAPPKAGTPTRDTQLANEIAALPRDGKAAVSEAMQQHKLRLPTEASGVQARAPTFTGALQANTAFALLGPFGAISETRPEFSWQPLAGALRYSVIIVDAGLHPVQRSRSLRTTVWRPRRPLRRGRTYLWQVTATLRGGSKVVASEPSPSETLLQIIPLKLAESRPVTVSHPMTPHGRS